MTQGDTKHSRSVKKNRSCKIGRKTGGLHSAEEKRADKNVKKHVAKRSGEASRARSLKVEFDQDFNATANGGAALGEKAMRSLALRRYVNEYLPARSEGAEYSIEDAAYALMAGLIVGGKGIQAGQCVREDNLLCDIFGLAKGAPSASTIYRVLCELSGLAERKREDCYVDSDRSISALDMLGRPRRERKLRRVVPERPEAATPDRREALDRFTSRFAIKCAGAVDQKIMRMHKWFVTFGDATDLEVDGRCFDAARVGRDGKKILRWQTLTLGPILAAQQLHEGNVDEGLSMPRLFERAREVVGAVAGLRARVLALLDAAYFERQVIDPLSDELKWDFIVCANQQRAVLRRIAEGQSEFVWENTGADARRGWRTSQVSCFTHLPENWSAPVTIIARRWIEEGEIDGAWHYSFIATRIEPHAMPKQLLDKHGYCSSLWMLYSTKQGRENHYKTPLRDFGLHHPPSCRLGVNQAFYAIAAAAANVAMVMRYRVVAKSERGIAFWRLRERYFRIAGRIAKTSRRLTVRLAGANIGAQRQVLWEHAFAAAGRL